MGQSLPLFLTRAAAMMLAGMLLFALSGRAHAADDTNNYGLKRFSGDNYDTVPARAAYPPAPMPSAYTPAPAGNVPPGYYPTLNGSASNNPASNDNVTPQVMVTPPPLTRGYQPAPVSAQPYGYKAAASDAAPVPAEAYGYKAVAPATPAYPAPRLASATPIRGDAYSYYQQGPRENADYVLGPGEKLKLNVFGEIDLSGEFLIDGSGYVRLPLIGQIPAAGYTAPQLEAAISGALAQGYLKSPRVSVEVSIYRPFYIIGAVNRPGQYPYVDHMNALNAIALAGGFTPSAVESVVFVRRDGSNQETEVPVDRTTAIHPGDVVKVHNTLFADAMSLLSPLSGAATVAAAAAIQ